MSKTKEILEDLIYPAIYASIQEVLPEFGFKKKGGENGYVSSNGLKIDGTEGDAQAKVRIYPNNISHLIDFRGGSVSLWDYIKRRHGLSDQETLRKLAEYAKVELPQRELTAEEVEKAKVYRRRAEIWEHLNTFLKRNFYDPTNEQATSKEAKAVREYLLKKRADGGRGYTGKDIEMHENDERPAVMEVGVITDIQAAYKYVRDKGYQDQEVRDTLMLTEDARIGKNGYHLTLPYRDGSGSIRGLIIRNIHYNGSLKVTDSKYQPKYLFTKSLEGIKSKLLYNIKPLTGGKDLLIVESQFDAQLATVRGLQNVVAIGGKFLSADQVLQALNKRPNSITILLDNEKATRPQVLAAIDAILNQAPQMPVFVAQINDENVKDLEEYIVAYSVEAFQKEVFDCKIIYWKYLLQNIFTEHAERVGDRELTDSEESHFMRSVVAASSKVKLPIDKAAYYNACTNALNGAGYNITPEVLQDTADQIRYSHEEEVKKSDFRKLLKTVQDLVTKGDTDKALEEILKKGREIKEKDHATEFSSLLVPITADGVRERLLNKSDNLDTGYSIGGDALLLPSGAISILAAPTSHGKTTFLINLALSVAGRYKNKQFHLFSYEEDADSILINSLNSYIGENLSTNNRRTIKSFFLEQTAQYVRGSDDDKDKFIQGKEEFFNSLITPQRYNIHYVDYDSDTLIDAIYHLHKNADIGGVFIDYMQLLHKGERGKNKYGSRQEELKQICMDLKDLSVSTGLPIILGAQFNRQVINQARLHPTMIGEAGDIERVANLILGFWNNNFEPFASKEEIEELNAKGLTEKGTIYVKILKQRGGKVGLTDALPYNGNAGKIRNSETGKQKKAPVQF